MTRKQFFKRAAEKMSTSPYGCCSAMALVDHKKNYATFAPIFEKVYRMDSVRINQRPLGYYFGGTIDRACGWNELSVQEAKENRTARVLALLLLSELTNKELP